MQHVARFPNQPVRVYEGRADADADAGAGAAAGQASGEAAFGLHWNILELYRSVGAGLRSALRDEPDVVSIGVDSWAVDYALLRGGRMLGAPYNYRDERTTAGVAAVHSVVGPAELYRLNGLQHLPFNSLFQLAADRASGDLALADTVLLIPDLLGYWLTGVGVAEITNASTTGLLNPHTRGWDAELMTRLGLPAGLLPRLAEPGSSLGRLLPEVASDLGAGPGVGVTLVGSHDTASAVVAVPATDDDFAYISSGTWSLVGVELESPVVSEEGRAANFTNEGGVDGRVRYLKNVSGLWLLSESVRTWERASGTPIELAELLARASAVTAPVSVFDAADDRFITPGDMPSRIADWCREHGVAVPQNPAEFTRSILESLAVAYATTVQQAAELTGKTVSAIHIVGGGSLNELLCQLTADRTGLTVLAGPVEATAIGNILVQARAAGMVPVGSSLEALRAVVSATFRPTRYRPRGR
ncbi:rhamnulokinase [Subtercola vilae]|uniref:Rhamnulokinase n=2 Tax=Microbacteriaceae TaxID=85023 RepID=A0A4T2BS60_9MICO|nr:rhamnulokinase [Subtercola vilae]